jgi:transcriptional regulator with XRE-family HTH domain
MDSQNETIAVAEENRREPTDDTRRIARRLAELRRKKGISQLQLCEELDLTQSMMSRYETGERRIPSELLAEFATAIGVSSDELLGIKPARKNGQEMTKDMKRLWKKFQQVTKLPEHDQRAVIRLINSLANTKARS